MQNKISDEDLKKIQELYKKGMKQKDIAKIFNVSQTTICYHILGKEHFREYRKEWFNKLPVERKKAIRKKNAPLILKYMNKKYATNPEFRERRKKHQREYENRPEVKERLAKYRLEHREKRLKYLREYRKKMKENKNE